MSLAVCEFCGRELDRDLHENYKQVTVWVNGPKADGAVLREETGTYAHKSCVDHLKAGQAVDQPDLFSFEDPAIEAGMNLISDEPGKVYKLTGPDSLHEALTAGGPICTCAYTSEKECPRHGD